MEKVELSIDRFTYYVSRDRVNAFPNSYFAVALSPHWNSNTDGENCLKLRIEGRSVELFEHIVAYINFGCIPRGSNGDYLIDRKLLPALREEADYFCLQELIDEIDCNTRSPDWASFLLKKGSMFNATIEDFPKSEHNELIIGCDVIEKGLFNIGSSDEDKLLYEAYQNISIALFSVYDGCSVLVVGDAQWQDPIMKGVGSISIDTTIREWEDKQHNWKCELNNEILDSISMFMAPQTRTYRHIFELDYVFINSTKSQVHSDVIEGCYWKNCFRLIVVVPTSHVGGDITIGGINKEDAFTVKTDECSTDCNTPERFKFIVAHPNLSINAAPIMSGKQILHVYTICHTKPRLFNETNPVNITHMIVNRNKMNELLELIMSLLSKIGYVSIILMEDYVNKGLTTKSLIEADATLYAKIAEMGIPVSLVYTLRKIDCNWYDAGYDIRLLNDERLDTRLPIHKTSKFKDSKVPFIASSNFLSGYEYIPKEKLDKLRPTGRRCIVATMIIGNGEITAKMN